MEKQTLRIGILLMAFSLLTSCATAPTGGQPATQQADQNATQKPAPNEAERAIFRQAIATGAIVGAGVGAGIGALAGKLLADCPGIGALIGAGVGAIAGGIAGKVVGEKQVEDYRNIQLSNDQFEKLLACAQQNNANFANYNNNLRQEITQIKCKEKHVQETIAKRKLKEAEEQQLQLAQASEERKKLSQTLVQPQMVQYQETLNDLNKEGQDLDGIIKELRSISEPAKIGELIPVKIYAFGNPRTSG